LYTVPCPCWPASTILALILALVLVLALVFVFTLVLILVPINHFIITFGSFFTIKFQKSTQNSFRSAPILPVFLTPFIPIIFIFGIKPNDALLLCFVCIGVGTAHTIIISPNHDGVRTHYVAIQRSV
jgi:hypothetical protein